MSCLSSCCASKESGEIRVSPEKRIVKEKPSVPRSPNSIVSPNTLVEIEPEKTMKKRITFRPKVDIIFDANKNQAILVVDIPGFTTNDIDVEVGKGMLTISGPKSQTELFEKYGDNLVLHAKERETGYFRRVFKLPDNVLDDTATAVYKSGMLEVKLNCTQFSKTRKIEVTS